MPRLHLRLAPEEPTHVLAYTWRGIGTNDRRRLITRLGHDLVPGSIENIEGMETMYHVFSTTPTKVLYNQIINVCRDLGVERDVRIEGRLRVYLASLDSGDTPYNDII